MSRTSGLSIDLNNYGQFRNQLRTLDTVIRDLDARIDNIGDSFDRLDRETRNSARGLDTFEREADGAGRSVDRLSRNAERSVGRLERMGGRLTGLGTKLSLALGAPLSLLTGAATNAAIEFEDAFAGVVKTVEATAEELEAISDGIRELATSTESPLAGLQNAQVVLAGIAENAGQLGIAKENILAFTETIGQLTLATDLTADSASFALAQFSNITGTTEFDRLGSAIVALGNNSATTESMIVSFAQRLAGAGTVAGLTEQELLGFSAAMASVGLNAEAGGTAFSRVLVDMTTAVTAGGKKLDRFAEISGLTATEFAEKWRNEPTQALVDFIAGLGELENEAQVQALADLGLDSVRVSDTLRRLSGNVDLVRDSIGLANTAWDENTALLDEANKRFSTTRSQLNLFKNNLIDVAISFGQAILPGLNADLGRFLPLLQRLADANPQMIQFAVGLAGVGIAAGPVLIVLGQILTAISAIGALSLSPIILVLGALGLAINDITRDIGGARAAWDNFLRSIGEFAGTIGSIAIEFTRFLQFFISGGEEAERTWSPVTSVLNRISSFLDALTGKMQQVQGFLKSFNLVASIGKTQSITGGLPSEQRQNALLSKREAILKRIADLQAKTTASAGTRLQHTIEEGDTLWDIARQYDTSVEAIVAANEFLEDRNTIILPGQELVIPTDVTFDGIDDSGDMAIIQMEKELLRIDRELEGKGRTITASVTLDTIIDDFKDTNLFQKIFGVGDVGVENARNVLSEMADEMQVLREKVDLVKDGFAILFTGNFRDGFDQIKEGVSGTIDSLREMIDIFSSRERIDPTNDPFFQINTQIAGTGLEDGRFDRISDAIADFVARVQDKFGELREMDLEELKQAVADNLEEIVRGGVTLAGIVLGGPGALAIGAARIVAKAIEDDFLGLGTFLEETGIGDSITNALQSLRSLIETAFQNIFGGGNLEGPAGVVRAEIEGGFADTGTTNPLVNAFNQMIEGVKEWVNNTGIPEIARAAGELFGGFAVAVSEGLSVALDTAFSADLTGGAEQVAEGASDNIIDPFLEGFTTKLEAAGITNPIDQLFTGIAGAMALAAGGLFLTKLVTAGFVTTLASTIGLAFSAAGLLARLTIIPVARGIVGVFTTSISTLFSGATPGLIAKLTTKIQGIFTALNAQITGLAGKGLFGRLIVGLGPIAGLFLIIVGTLRNLDEIIATIQDSFGKFRTAIDLLTSGDVGGALSTFASGLKGIFIDVPASVISGAADAVIEFLESTGILGDSLPSVEEGFRAIANGITFLFNNVADIIDRISLDIEKKLLGIQAQFLGAQVLLGDTGAEGLLIEVKQRQLNIDTIDQIRRNIRGQFGDEPLNLDVPVSFNFEGQEKSFNLAEILQDTDFVQRNASSLRPTIEQALAQAVEQSDFESIEILLPAARVTGVDSLQALEAIESSLQEAMANLDVSAIQQLIPIAELFGLDTSDAGLLLDRLTIDDLPPVVVPIKFDENSFAAALQDALSSDTLDLTNISNLIDISGELGIDPSVLGLDTSTLQDQIQALFDNPDLQDIEGLELALNIGDALNLDIDNESFNTALNTALEQNLVDLSDSEALLNISTALNEGLAAGLEDDGVASDAMTAWTERLIGSAQDGFGIESPSLVFQEIGMMLMEGLILGIDESGELIAESLAALTPYFTTFQLQATNTLMGVIRTLEQVIQSMNRMGPVMIKAAQQVVTAAGRIAVALERVISRLETILQLQGQVKLKQASAVPTPAAPPFADGGVTLSSGLALVGERGPELISLDRQLAILNADSTAAFLTGLDIGQNSISAPTDLPTVNTTFIPPPSTLPSVTNSSNTSTTTISTGDIQIVVPEGTQEVSPEVIAEGLQRYYENNPPQRVLSR